MATIKDIGTLVGVSTTTVSLVLSGKAGSRISPETARRVWEVARQLGYEPNLTARRLRSRRQGRERTFCVGFVITTLIVEETAPYYSEVLNGIQLEAMTQGYHLFLGSGFRSVQEKLSYLRRLSQDVDGWLLGGVVEPELLDWLRQARIPTVLLGGGSVSSEFDCVTPDDFEAGRISAEHLLELGHREVVFLSYPPGTQSMRNRVAGFRERLTDAKVRTDGLLEYADATPEAVERWLRNRLETGKMPTAIAATDDRMAMLVIKGFYALGVPVPDGASVIGFDDVPIAQLWEPPLTTVRMPMRDIGKFSLRRLLERIESPELPPTKMVLPVELVVRKSTAPPPS